MGDGYGLARTRPPLQFRHNLVISQSLNLFENLVTVYDFGLTLFMSYCGWRKLVELGAFFITLMKGDKVVKRKNCISFAAFARF